MFPCVDAWRSTHVLEAAWGDAEGIAAIADDRALPASVDAQLAQLRERDPNRR